MIQFTKETDFKYISAATFFRDYCPEVKGYKMKMKHGNWTEEDKRIIQYGIMKLSQDLMKPVK